MFPLLVCPPCRVHLVYLACVGTLVPRERRDTRVLLDSLDPQESREKKETEVFLGPRAPPDPKERL